jgi:hypothetical protein
MIGCFVSSEVGRVLFSMLGTNSATGCQLNASKHPRFSENLWSGGPNGKNGLEMGTQIQLRQCRAGSMVTV